MFHLCAWEAALAATANTDIAPVSDDILQIQNSHFLLGRDYDLIAAYAAAVTLIRARLNSGVIRQTNPLYIVPFETLLLPANDPNVAWWGAQPYRLKALDEIIMEASDSAAGPNNFHGFAWLGTGWTPAPAGNITWMRLTSTTTAVANSWTTLISAAETNLPVGRYAVVGGQVQSTTICGWRLIFDNQVERPGGLGQAALGSRSFWEMYNLKLGTFGYFNTVSIPRVQVLCNAADAAFEILLAVIPVGPG